MFGHWTPRQKKLLIAAALLCVLCPLSGCAYWKKAREEELRKDLRAMRDGIDQYTLDKDKAPQSLRDLVSANYLKEIPKDPMTGSNQTWQVVQVDRWMAVDRQEPGIDDVHSGSHAIASDGTSYNTW